MDWKESFSRLATTRVLTGETLRVLFAILATMDAENFSSIWPIHIAQTVSISRQAVNRAINKLEEVGFVERRYISGKVIGFDVLLFHKKGFPPD